MARTRWLIFACLALGVFAGCSDNKSETGYEAHKLNMTEAQRRSLYASPFSPEAKAAQEKRDEMETRPPGTPGGM